MYCVTVVEFHFEIWKLVSYTVVDYHFKLPIIVIELRIEIWDNKHHLVQYIELLN